MKKFKRKKENEIKMTNEEYRAELQNIFDEMKENQKLHFWYTYIIAIEKE